jgi:hypothetical protein
MTSPAYQMLTETIDALVAAGRMPPRCRPHAEVFAWSAVHGLAMLLLDGPLSNLPESDREPAIERALDGVADGLTR